MALDSTTNIRAQVPLLASLSGMSRARADYPLMSKVQTNFKAKPARHFIRQWRKHRGYTLEQLAEMVGVTHGALSQLERGLVNYTQPMLEALAVALSCEPADLIMRDPANPVWTILDTLKDLTPDQQNQVAEIVTTFRKAS